jgi:predicted double-glycine peptidase
LTWRGFLAILVSVWLFLPAGALAAEIPIRLNAYSEGGVLTKQVMSLKEMRQRQMVPQTRDFSCGAAALATLMHYYYGQPISELDAILGMFKHGDQEDIKKRGFSLLDMKRYVNTLKYKANGFKIPKLEVLKNLKIPVITLIETNNFKHFVVIRQADDRFVYLADPSWGNRKVSFEEFGEIWPQHVIFAVQGVKVGTPEGLFVEVPSFSSEVSQMLRREPFLETRLALDPAFNIINVSNTPLFILPFIPGQ